MSDHASLFARELNSVLMRMDVRSNVEAMVGELVALRDRHGRLFCIGVGGGAANAAHAVNDFRKLCAIEAYAPTDGISELTARANDEGWNTVFVAWLQVSKFTDRDAILVFSVGGGHASTSACIFEAVDFVNEVGGSVYGVVGRADGAVGQRGTLSIVVGPLKADVAHLLTPVTETVQVAILHTHVSDDRLKCNPTKW